MRPGPIEVSIFTVFLEPSTVLTNLLPFKMYILNSHKLECMNGWTNSKTGYKPRTVDFGDPSDISEGLFSDACVHGCNLLPEPPCETTPLHTELLSVSPAVGMTASLLWPVPFTMCCGYAQLLSCVGLSTTFWTVSRQAPLSMGFSQQEDWSGLPFPPPVDLLDPGVEPSSPWQADSLPLSPLGSLYPVLCVPKMYSHWRLWIQPENAGGDWRKVGGGLGLNQTNCPCGHLASSLNSPSTTF